ncbi:Uncharacterised protein [Mycobacterium tuberculosis]|uniref:Uncharacterized protein n=1 Tax=Mycobacterium tuberculosis TaxID=1773 RepID=A0A655JT72_MYCTX|nr:Uncharacterised protein [Mycobacterium tuberculosis]
MRTVDSRVRSSSLAIQAERICARGSTALIRFRILAKLLSKWSTTSLALGSSPGVRIAEA